MNPFVDKQCRDYSNDEMSLNLSEIEEKRQHTPEWQYCANENHLIRTYRFTNFGETMKFVNKIAQVVDNENHHPEMVVGYNRCKISFFTHSVGGVTDNDFICASKIDQL